jgi:hypothetical protein
MKPRLNSYYIRLAASLFAFAGVCRAQFVDPEVNKPLWTVQQVSSSGAICSISTLGVAGSPQFPFALGFAVADGDGCVLIRGIGASLSRFGVQNCMSKPSMVLYDSKQRVVANSLTWSAIRNSDRNQIRLVFQAVGLFDIEDGMAEAIIMGKLAPGAYTVVITSAEGASGAVLGEVYKTNYVLQTGQ